MPAPIPDVRSRFSKTLLQGFIVTLLSAAGVTLLTLLGTVTSWGEFGGALIAFSTFQAVATAVVSWAVNTGINAVGALDDIAVADDDMPTED